MTIIVNGKCPCGHDVDPDDQSVCLVFDREGAVHRVPQSSGYCVCCPTPVSIFDIDFPPPPRAEEKS